MDRDNSIDDLRLMAIFAIIVLHGFPFFYVEGLYSFGIVVNQLVRFAVPCFFVISGYLYAQRVSNHGTMNSLRRSASRILLLFFFWSLFYILPYNVTAISDAEPGAHLVFAKFHLGTWIKNPQNFLLIGSKAHLWFLPALLCATLFCSPFIAYRRFNIMLVLTAMIFALALLGGPYKNTLVEFRLPLEARNGPLFSSIFFAIGATLAQVKDRRHFLALGMVLTLVGACGQLLETFRMVWAGYVPLLPVYPDFVISTLPFGVGAAMIGISGAVARHNKPWLWGAGRYTLGIYALHVFVMDLFLPVAGAHINHLWWQLLASPLYFALTVLLVLCLSRIRPVRPFIS